MGGSAADADLGLARIEPYLRDLIAEVPASPHSIRIDCEGDLALPVAELSEIAVVVREAVANALAHAFPVRPKGAIWVRVSSGDDRIQLTIRDDGIGIGDLYDAPTGGRARIMAAAERLGGRVRMGSSPFGGGAVSLTYRTRKSQQAKGFDA